MSDCPSKNATGQSDQKELEPWIIYCDRINKCHDDNADLNQIITDLENLKTENFQEYRNVVFGLFRNDIEAYIKIIDAIDFEITFDKQQRTFLLCHAKSGCLEPFKELIKNLEEKNKLDLLTKTDKNGMSVLNYAASDDKAFKNLELLHGKFQEYSLDNINGEFNGGKNIFFNCCHNVNLESFIFVLKNYDVDFITKLDDEGNDAIVGAIKNGKVPTFYLYCLLFYEFRKDQNNVREKMIKYLIKRPRQKLFPGIDLEKIKNNLDEVNNKLGTILNEINKDISLDLDNRFQNGKTMFHFAIAVRAKKIYKTLQKMGCDIDIPDNNGNHALHSAIWSDYPYEYEYLVEELEVDVNITNNNSETPLMLAAQRGMIRSIQFLKLKDVDPNLQDVNGYTALHHAVDRHKVNAVRELLLYDKVDLNIKANNQLTAREIAEKQKFKDIVELFTQRANRNLGPNEQIYYGNNVTDEQKKIAKKIKRKDTVMENPLELIKDVSIDFIWPLNPLNYFVNYKDDNVIVKLLQSDKSIDFNIVDAYGTRAIILAGISKSPSYKPLLESDKVRKDLCDIYGRTLSIAMAVVRSNRYNFRPSPRTPPDETPITRLIEMAKTEVKLKSNQDFFALGANNETVLHHIAARKGFGEVVKQILEIYGENLKQDTIDQQDFTGRTALHYAVINQNEETVQMLIDKKANLRIRDVLMRTPLEYSVIFKNENIFKKLLENMHLTKDEKEHITKLITKKNRKVLLEIELVKDDLTKRLTLLKKLQILKSKKDGISDSEKVRKLFDMLNGNIDESMLKEIPEGLEIVCRCRNQKRFLIVQEKDNSLIAHL